MKRILFLFFALLLSGCLQPVEESFTHEVEYEVSISFREISEIEQTNVTLLIPFPAVRGDVIEPRNMSVPEGWRAEIVESPHGRMLRLTGESIKTWKMKPIPVGIEEGNNTPKQTPQLVKRPASYEFKLNLRLNREVNTLNPIGEEYLLEPKFNLGEMECPEDDPHYRNTRCFNYTTFIYYESEPFVNASLSIWLNGRNSWFQMGWTGNEFNDRIYVENLREGWNEVRGLLETGIGVYR